MQLKKGKRLLKGKQWRDALIDDCQVSDWVAKAGSACSKPCGGGTQPLVRSIRSHKVSAFGVTCDFYAQKSERRMACNTHEC